MEIIGPVAGALIGSDSAGDAADAQAGAAAASTAEQRRQYDLTRQDYAPWRSAGTASINQLAMLLGLNPEALIDRARFTTPSTPGTPASTATTPTGGWMSQGDTMIYGPASAGTPGTPEIFDQAGYDAAVRAADRSGDPQFGSLMQQFTGKDLEKEPGYIFGMNQGVQARDRSASASGSLYSGAQMKALNRFGQDYGGTKFNEAFNRDNINKNRIFNMLSGVAGTWQTAVNQIGQAGQNMANQISGNMIGAGNARAASGIAQGNAWQNALNQGISAYNRGNQPSGYGGYNDNYPPQYSAAPPYYDYGTGGYQ